MGIISTGPGGPLAFSSASGGKTYVLNNVTITPAVVAPANPSRQTLVFHNPGTIDIFIAPSVDANGAAIAPSTIALGGCFRVIAGGGTFQVTGECQKPWQAFALSGVGNPLTIMDSNV